MNISDIVNNPSILRKIKSLTESFDSFIWFINNEFKSYLIEYKFINYYRIFENDVHYKTMNSKEEVNFWNFILYKFKERHGRLFDITYKPQNTPGDLFMVKFK
jgi:hypothetical protein